MVKKVLLLAVLALALPLAAFANSSSIDFTNSGGTLSGGSSGLSLSGSTLIAVNNWFGSSGIITGSLGSFSFTTGPLLSGSLSGGNATFANGGSFTINGNGTNGLPNGVIFSGVFAGNSPVQLQEFSAGSTYWYTVSGTIQGTLSSGSKTFNTTGATVQLTVFTHKGPLADGGSVSISSGDTNIVVPEPGTLSLFGTGLIGLAGLVRRKLNLI